MRTAMDVPELAGTRPVARSITRKDLQELAEHDRQLTAGRDPKFPGPPERTCVAKRRYGLRAAHRAARVMRTELGEEVRPYPCPYCTRYHVGHETPALV